MKTITVPSALAIHKNPAVVLSHQSQILNPTEISQLIRCEQRIAAGLETFMEVGAALLEIREAKLYRQQYATFEEYCSVRWQMTARRARQLSDASAVIQNLQAPLPSAHLPSAISGKSGTTVPIGLDTRHSTLPSSESVARPLTTLPKSEQRATWSEAVATAPRDEEDRPRVTAAHVQQVVDRRQGKPQVIEVEAARFKGDGGICKACSVHKFLASRSPELHVKIEPPFEHGRDLFTVGSITYSKDGPCEAEAFQLLYNKDYIVGKDTPHTYEGRVVVWRDEHYILGPKTILRAIKQKEFALEPEVITRHSTLDTSRPIALMTRDLVANLGALEELLLQSTDTVSASMVRSAAKRLFPVLQKYDPRPKPTQDHKSPTSHKSHLPSAINHKPKRSKNLQSKIDNRAITMARKKQSALYVICREPHKNATHPTSRKPRYAPGWCLDPSKAQHYTLDQATKLANGDTIMPLAKAQTRFAKATP